MVDAVLQSLAHPARRALLEQIIGLGTTTVAELTRRNDMTQSGISQHLQWLKQARLIVGRQEGRMIKYRARPNGLAPLANWIGKLRGD